MSSNLTWGVNHLGGDIVARRWVELTEDYCTRLRPYARRKIRLAWGNPPYEIWATWDESEECWFWSAGEDAVYMSDEFRPTHVMIG